MSSSASSARLLQFPMRKERKVLSPEEAQAIADAYLKKPEAERTDGLRDAFVCDADVLTEICKQLGNQKDVAPPFVFAEATSLYAWVSKRLGK